MDITSDLIGHNLKVKVVFYVYFLISISKTQIGDCSMYVGVIIFSYSILSFDIFFIHFLFSVEGKLEWNYRMAHCLGDL